LIELNADPVSDFEVFEHFNAGDAKNRGMALRHLEDDFPRFRIDRDDDSAEQSGGGSDLTGSQSQ
jgi:hypothetical protein